jgi:hypothetical protein
MLFTEHTRPNNIVTVVLVWVPQVATSTYNRTAASGPRNRQEYSLHCYDPGYTAPSSGIVQSNEDSYLVLRPGMSQQHANPCQEDACGSPRYQTHALRPPSPSHSLTRVLTAAGGARVCAHLNQSIFGRQFVNEEN